MEEWVGWNFSADARQNGVHPTPGLTDVRCIIHAGNLKRWGGGGDGVARFCGT